MLTDKQLKHIQDYKEHCKECDSICCHHDLWAPPPCWFGDKECRCLECFGDIKNAI